MLWGIVELIRDVAVIAAAAGIAKWAWDQHTSGPAQRDAEASAAMARERENTELRTQAGQWGAKMEALAVDISTRLDEILLRQRDQEAREDLKVAIHRILQSTDDPFLTFDEIRAALAAMAPLVPPLVPPVVPLGGPPAEAPPSEPEFRRALMELVAAGIASQLERDRYFAASSYEADDEDEA